MSELISRQAAINVVRNIIPDNRSIGTCEELERLPPIQPKRGRWINGHCSECNEHAPYWCMASTYHASNFCPNCGADMREVSE